MRFEFRFSWLVCLLVAVLLIASPANFGFGQEPDGKGDDERNVDPDVPPAEAIPPTPDGAEDPSQVLMRNAPADTNDANPPELPPDSIVDVQDLSDDVDDDLPEVFLDESGDLQDLDPANWKFPSVPNIDASAADVDPGPLPTPSSSGVAEESPLSDALLQSTIEQQVGELKFRMNRGEDVTKLVGQFVRKNTGSNTRNMELYPIALPPTPPTNDISQNLPAGPTTFDQNANYGQLPSAQVPSEYDVAPAPDSEDMEIDDGNE